jgi:hypothetical protein
VMMRAQLLMVARLRKQWWKFLGAINMEAAGAADFFGSKKMGPTSPLSGFRNAKRDSLRDSLSKPPVFRLPSFVVRRSIFPVVEVALLWSCVRNSVVF